SSDVCSSDLGAFAVQCAHHGLPDERGTAGDHGPLAGESSHRTSRGLGLVRDGTAGRCHSLSVRRTDCAEYEAISLLVSRMQRDLQHSEHATARMEVSTWPKTGKVTNPDQPRRRWRRVTVSALGTSTRRASRWL